MATTQSSGETDAAFTAGGESVHQNPVEYLLSALDVRVSAFAICLIENGWRLKVSPLPTLVCHFVVRGKGVLEVGGEHTPIEAGAVIVVPEGTRKCITGPGKAMREVRAEDSCAPHSEGIVTFKAGNGGGDLVLGCASLSATYVTGHGIFDGLDRPVTMNIGSNPALKAGFNALLQEFSEPRWASKAMAECLMKQILIWMLRDPMLELAPEVPILHVMSDSRLLPAVSAVLAHPEERHSVASLAALAGMSRSSFASRFTKRLEQSPMEFLHTIRMRSAARLLLGSQLPVKCLASAVGYSSRSYFSRAFKEAFGTDPSSFRERGRV
jgi:AraC-like DNA-binding protein